MTTPQWLAAWFAQTAVYWANPTPDGDGGLTFDAPVEIACRWEDHQEALTDGHGDQFVSRASVYSETAMDLDGFLYLGTLDALSSGEQADPQTVKTAYQVRAIGTMTTRKGTEWARQAWL